MSAISDLFDKLDEMAILRKISGMRLNEKL